MGVGNATPVVTHEDYYGGPRCRTDVHVAGMPLEYAQLIDKPIKTKRNFVGKVGKFQFNLGKD